jgi:cytochrome c peroxidase
MIRCPRFSSFTRLLLPAILAVGTAAAQNLGSLKRITPPQPTNLTQYVRDQASLVVLGKALFWDMQAGSDGRTACATCHFHAGADHRAQNQLSNLGTLSPNGALTAADFPFHQLSNVANRNSTVVRDSSAVAGSAGAFLRKFIGVTSGSPFEDGYDLATAPLFSISGVNTRQVTPRNSPSIINSVFNVRNFWDGRASDIFTGATPFGASDTALNAVNVSTGAPVREAIRVANASLASQSVGPALSNVEMSYDGRAWPQMGRKLLSLRPLALQRVAPDDSVLGPYAVAGARGLSVDTYQSLVQAAFQPAYWNSAQTVDGYTAAEQNFGLFWGLAIQAYESTLIANDSRVDQFFDGNTNALTADEQAGLRLFQGGRGDCTNCHAGAEMTLASFSGLNQNGGNGRRGGNRAAQDPGFFRTGVRPITDDVGVGGLDGFGNPLSRTVAQNANASGTVQGLFKTPGLRNVEFTGPYQHNGGQATLDQVVEFYGRGGDFAGNNIGPGIGNKNFSATDRAQLVAFLKALSDDRVRFERAPFDHPELCVTVGQQQSDAQSLILDTSDPRFRLSAADRWAGLPAVGSKGNSAPLQTFEELLNGIGADGARAHSLTDSCSIF